MSIKNNLNPRDLVPTQIPTAIPGIQQVALVPLAYDYSNQEYSNPTQTVTAVELDARIEMEPDHKEEIQKLSKTVRQKLYSTIKNFSKIANDKVKTISIRNAIIIDKLSGNNIFFSEEFDQKFSIQDLTTPAKGKKRQLLPAFSENPAKKRRTAADDQNQPTPIEVNAPYFHQIPVYYLYQAPSTEIPASTTPQEPSISPGTTVVSEEFSSTFESNATAETNHSESSSGSSSPSNSSQVLNNFELEEFNNGEIGNFWNSENTVLNWSDWNFNFNQ